MALLAEEKAGFNFGLISTSLQKNDSHLIKWQYKNIDVSMQTIAQVLPFSFLSIWARWGQESSRKNYVNSEERGTKFGMQIYGIIKLQIFALQYFCRFCQ